MSLHEGKSGDVNVRVGKEIFKLRAGEELVVSDNSEINGKDANPVPGVGVRSLNERKLANGGKAFVWDFSLPSAITRINTLSQLARSAQGADRALYQKMLKNAVALQVLTAKKGPYSAMH
jgi:hypothetical protein